VRTRAVLTSILASAGVIIIGWQAGAAATTTTQSTASPSGATGSATANSGSSSTTTTATAPTAPVAAAGTFTGDDVNTRFGSVQVQITVAGGAITDVTALQLTDHDRRSASISSRAAPILRSEVLDAQSANVSNVSGATYTSDAYLQSLQSAIDQAGL
jgi:uncharacterized protein with FMN-binding domain